MCVFACVCSMYGGPCDDPVGMGHHHMGPHAGMAGLQGMGLGMNMAMNPGHPFSTHPAATDPDLCRKYNFAAAATSPTKAGGGGGMGGHEDPQAGGPMGGMTLNLVKTEALTPPYMYTGMAGDHHPHHHHAGISTV